MEDINDINYYNKDIKSLYQEIMEIDSSFFEIIVIKDVIIHFENDINYNDRQNQCISEHIEINLILTMTAEICDSIYEFTSQEDYIFIHDCTKLGFSKQHNIINLYYLILDDYSISIKFFVYQYSIAIDFEYYYKWKRKII